MINQERIKKNVFMKNELLKVFNENVQNLNDFLNKFKGSKILKADNDFFKSVKEQMHINESVNLTPLNSGDSVKLHHFYIGKDSFKSGCLWLNVSLCFCGGSYEDKTYYCNYEKDSFYLGYIKDGVLNETSDLKAIDLINEDEEIKAVIETERLKEEYENAKSKIKISENKKYL